MRGFSWLLVALIATGCTQHPKVGGMLQPTTFIQTKNIDRVTAKLSELCDRNGFTIDESTKNAVICSRASSAVAQAFMGTKYGTDVRSRIRLNAFPVDSGQIKVVANGWYESQNVYGQTNKDTATHPEAYGVMQGILDQAKQEIEQRASK